MSREQSPDRKKAAQLWLKSKRTMKPAEIAAKIGVSAALIRKWKSLDKWDELPEPRKGAPRGNRNAKGNKGGPGGPIGNDKAVTHGAFRKYMPQDPDYLEIMDMVQQMDPLDMIYQGIESSFVAFIRLERIMYVESKEEMIKELKKQKFEIHKTGRGKNTKFHQEVTEEEFEFQFAWDRYETYIKTQSVVLTQLRASIKQFLNVAPEDDERRAKLKLMTTRIEKTRLEIEKIKGGGKKSESDDWVSALKEAAERRRSKEQPS